MDVGPSVSPSFEKSTRSPARMGVSPYIGRELVRGSESAGRLGFKPYFWNRSWRQTYGPDTCSGLYEWLE